MSTLRPLADERADTMVDLQGRALQASLLGLVAIGQSLVLVGEARHLDFAIDLYGMLVMLYGALLWLLAARSEKAARVAVAVGIGALTLIAMYWFQAEALVGLWILPPAIACLLLGTAYGVAGAVLCSAVVLVDIPYLVPSGDYTKAVTLLTLWAVQAVLYGALNHIAEVAERSWAGYASMRGLLEGARDQQLRLRQAQDDVVQSNLELARVSERLAYMRQMAEEARGTKEEFLANVSHELRTPLNMIIGFTEMITQTPSAYGDVSPKLLADIEVIQSNSQHLASLVNDVLDLSQVDAGRMTLTKEWVPMRDLVGTAVTAVRPLFDSKGLYLQQDVPEEFPLYCDRTRIRQVIVNLLSNAGRFTDQGGARVEVRRGARELTVTVSDSGPGIAPQDQERIFQPFEQASTGLRRHGGSGLGLAISKRFVELHGGRMWLQSESGKGSTFFFALPTVDDTAPASPGMTRWFSPYHPYEPRTRPSLAPELRLTPRLVALEQGSSLRRLLTRHWSGAEVVVVRDLDQAAEQLTRFPAQALIISDPALDELPDKLRRLTTLPFSTPVVACWLPDKQEVAERMGVVEYLIKPVSRAKLLSALDRLPGPLRTVLVADDEPDALQLFGRTLSSAERGYRVLRATTGQRALELLRQRRPDALLLDLIMPGMDGYTLLKEKSADPTIRDIPVVAISAQDISQGHIATDYMIVGRSGGLSLEDLLHSVEAVSSGVGPGPESTRPAPPETQGA